MRFGSCSLLCKHKNSSWPSFFQLYSKWHGMFSLHVCTWLDWPLTSWIINLRWSQFKVHFLRALLKHISTFDESCTFVVHKLSSYRAGPSLLPSFTVLCSSPSDVQAAVEQERSFSMVRDCLGRPRGHFQWFSKLRINVCRAISQTIHITGCVLYKTLFTKLWHRK